VIVESGVGLVRDPDYSAVLAATVIAMKCASNCERDKMAEAEDRVFCYHNSADNG
jgi:hypothetical protein